MLKINNTPRKTLWFFRLFSTFRARQAIGSRGRNKTIFHFISFRHGLSFGCLSGTALWWCDVQFICTEFSFRLRQDYCTRISKADHRSHWQCYACKPFNKATSKTTASLGSLTSQRSLILQSVIQELDKINLKLSTLQNLAADVKSIKIYSVLIIVMISYKLS